MRLVAAPFLFYCIVVGVPIGWMVSLLLLAVATDVLDGYLAHRLGVASSFGAHLDVGADLLVTAGAFLAFALKGIYPAWTLLPIGVMFGQFALTSGSGGLRYDPVGRHYGTFLFFAIGVTLLLRDFAVEGAVLVALVVMTIVSVACRAAFLLGKAACRRISSNGG